MQFTVSFELPPLAAGALEHGAIVPKSSFNWNGKRRSNRGLFRGYGGSHRRGGLCVFKRPVLAAALSQHCHCLGVCNFLPGVPQALMMRRRPAAPREWVEGKDID